MKICALQTLLSALCSPLCAHTTKFPPMDKSIKPRVMDKSSKSDASNFQANNDIEEKYDGEEDGIDKSGE